MLSSLAETDFIPITLYQLGLTRAFLYNGPSMQPTFRPGQVLYTRMRPKEPQPGDVLVYEKTGKMVVHRLCSVTPNGYILRGDNNYLKDAELVTPAQVLGRVEAVGDNKGSHMVLGGRLGLWRSRLRWTFLHFEQPTRLILGWPYRFMKATGWMARLWKPDLEVMRLGHGGAFITKYLFHGQTVAVWDSAQKRFTCCKPFDLVLRSPEDNI
jgi:hypothetical protein